MQSVVETEELFHYFLQFSLTECILSTLKGSPDMTRNLFGQGGLRFYQVTFCTQLLPPPISPHKFASRLQLQQYHQLLLLIINIIALSVKGQYRRHELITVETSLFVLPKIIIAFKMCLD
ncbi:hypothetical protein EGR_10275 [Echinococcus granulosus]|uniref:Uncharacterized protein n=1 Tax=Echinococcus granulosus TaxID=6210 RepID=W6U8N9_ECHGR|nr:hypothetical protein EGR_10275 [Echinococcus granulosus]EUB54857.1 hypothetical protein EGR_10275 [Echinococcus granulosus]